MVTVHPDGTIDMSGIGIHLTSKGIAQAQQVFGAITYHPATGYSTVQRSTTLADLARWLGTDEATALDWIVYKVAAFRGASEDEARNIVTGNSSA